MLFYEVTRENITSIRGKYKNVLSPIIERYIKSRRRILFPAKSELLPQTTLTYNNCTDYLRARIHGSSKISTTIKNEMWLSGRLGIYSEKRRPPVRPRDF